jgi:hypothetical protein
VKEEAMAHWGAVMPKTNKQTMIHSMIISTTGESEYIKFSDITTKTCTMYHHVSKGWDRVLVSL